MAYERRCRWVATQHNIRAELFLGLEFGFLMEASYSDNRRFFEKESCHFMNGLDEAAHSKIASMVSSVAPGKDIAIFVDISSMSREMIANVALGIQVARQERNIEVVAAYAPSKYAKISGPGPIRLASPVKPSLAGWSSRPDKPVGAVFGLGCEPGLALGALQVLEPDKAWIFRPRGIDPRFDTAMEKANEHIASIFDVTYFDYEIQMPSITRGRFEALLNSVGIDFRLIAVPFGPKIFAWLVMSTVVFGGRLSAGVWAFSSKDHAILVDRDAAGPVIWHSMSLPTLQAQGT